jgi:hypothetical protein
MIFTSEEMFRARAKELTAYFGRPVETGCDLSVCRSVQSYFPCLPVLGAARFLNGPKLKLGKNVGQVNLFSLLALPVRGTKLNP